MDCRVCLVAISSESPLCSSLALHSSVLFPHSHTHADTHTHRVDNLKLACAGSCTCSHVSPNLTEVDEVDEDEDGVCLCVRPTSSESDPDRWTRDAERAGGRAGGGRRSTSRSTRTADPNVHTITACRTAQQHTGHLPAMPHSTPHPRRSLEPVGLRGPPTERPTPVTALSSNRFRPRRGPSTKGLQRFET